MSLVHKHHQCYSVDFKHLENKSSSGLRLLGDVLIGNEQLCYMRSGTCSSEFLFMYMCLQSYNVFLNLFAICWLDKNILWIWTTYSFRSNGTPINCPVHKVSMKNISPLNTEHRLALYYPIPTSSFAKISDRYLSLSVVCTLTYSALS